MRSRLLARVVAFLFVVMATGATVSGCGGEDLESMSQRDMALRIEARAVEISTLLNLPLVNPAISPSGCSISGSSDGVFSEGGSFNFDLGVSDVSETMPTFQRLHDHWVTKGFTVTAIETFPDGGHRVQARDDEGGFTYDVESVDPPTAVAMFIDSKCFQATDPDNNTFRWVPSKGTWTAPPSTPSSSPSSS